MPNPPEHKLRWYQYKLSSLFILTTLVAIACSCYATRQHHKSMKTKMYRLLCGRSSPRLKSLKVSGQGLDVTCQNEEALRYLESAMGNHESGYLGGILYRFEFFFEDGGSYSKYGYCWENGIAMDMPGHEPWEMYIIVFSEPRPEEIERMCRRLGIRSSRASKPILPVDAAEDNHQ